MTDLEVRFNATAVGTEIRQPPLADLRRRAVRRRGHRRASAGAALSVALACAGVVVALHGDPPPVTAPPATTDVDEVWIGADGAAVAVELPRDGDCRPSLRVSTDGGVTWSQARVPSEIKCPGPPNRTFPIDLRLRLVDVAVFVLSVDADAYLSRDGGHSWVALLDGVTDVDAFPADARPAWCGGCARTYRPLAVDPTDHTVYKLRHDLPVTVLPDVVSTGSDGSLWATAYGLAQDPVRPPWTVLRSTDRGRTWQTSASPETIDPHVVARTGDEAYLYQALTDNQAPTDPTVPEIRRTTDGGRTWHRLATDLPAVALLNLLVGPDGGLVAVTAPPGRLQGWTSTDGIHFVARTSVSSTGVSGTDGRYAWTIDGAVAHATDDGVHWTTVALP